MYASPLSRRMQTLTQGRSKGTVIPIGQDIEWCREETGVNIHSKIHRII
jgi:hypothetical protein